MIENCCSLLPLFFRLHQSWSTINNKYLAIQGATRENAIVSFVPDLPFCRAVSFSSTGTGRIPA
jgi:hypothetical protein